MASSTDELREHARRLENALRDRILHVPARRAALRAAIGMDLDNPRAWRGYREVAPFLPNGINDSTRRAFLAVAALMAAEPARRRQGSDPTVSTDDAHAEPTQADPGEETEDAPPTRGSSKPTLGNLGKSCAEAVRLRHRGEKAMEDHLHALCRADCRNLHRQLPRLVSQLRDRRVPIHWAELIADVAQWEWGRRYVIRRWMRDFYRNLPSPDAAADDDRALETETHA